MAVMWWLVSAGPRPEFVDLARMLTVSGLVQVWLFGLCAWFSRYRSLTAAIAVGAIGLGITQGLFAGMFMGPAPFRSFELPTAGLFAIFGAMLTYDAYRRWLVTDFD